ncbi:MAG TPA: hypothetical protein VKY74_23480 [Chloroflexia bacterium]|nr:hypothetical protein [Chloroflexia bacterium]
MGIDIHMYAERIGLDGWELVGGMEPNEYVYCGRDEVKVPYKPVEIYDQRRAALFAILANVRNPAWAAERYRVIAPPRGLPADVSAEVCAWASCCQLGEEDGAFGASWLTLRELRAFDWTGQSIQKQAMVDPVVAALFHPDAPFPYAAWPPDQPIQYAEYHRGGVTVRWRETYAESAGIDFLDGVLPLLEQLGPPDGVRIVFWFDG